MSTKDLNPQVPGESPAVEPAPEVPETPEATEAPEAIAAPAKPRGLPDASTIDPNKIPRAVLCRQGWIVPSVKLKD